MRFHLPHRKTTFATALAAGVVGVFTAFPAMAQVDLGLQQVEGTGLATGDIRLQIAGIIRVFFGLLGIIAVGLILYAGWLWMTSQGDDSKIEEAKGIIKNAVIGLVIILSAYAIATFVINAITGSTGGGITGGCQPGQICEPGPENFHDTGGLARVTGITPGGAGPNKAGWPKNYRITVGFTHDMRQATALNGTTVRVQRCNARVNGSGAAQPFQIGSCTAAISGKAIIDGRKLVYAPDATPGTDPTYFEANYWYMMTLLNGPNGLLDVDGHSLVCPQPLTGSLDYSSPDLPAASCGRAIAFNDVVDITPPTASIVSPSTPPNSCGKPPRLPIQVDANDDFLVTNVSILLDGKSDGLVDVNGAPFTTPPDSVNVGNKNPFSSSDVYIKTSSLTPGQSYEISAVARDGGAQASSSVKRTFTMAPAQCCNGKRDDNELGVDCGGSSRCGACTGNACATDADCASGYCDPKTHACVENPIIQGVDAWNGGPGSLVTISGQYFGLGGSVVFLGKTDDPSDDKVAHACSIGAWKSTEAVVVVPDGAVSGPLRLITNDGKYDDTTADSQPGVEGTFTAGGPTHPGICYLEPAGGPAGAEFVVHGSGFGASRGIAPSESFGKMGTTVMDIAKGGWATDAVHLIAPAVRDGVYPVRMWIGGASATPTNTVEYAVQPGGETTDPTITDVSPTNGPVGQYITLTGSGFGNRKGKVKFFDGPIAGSPEIAIGEDPVCDDSWHDKVVVVKVPTEYQAAVAKGVKNPLALKTHLVRIETAAPSKVSNTVEFSVNKLPVTPGLCSLSPLNGPPGTLVTVQGSGFGSHGPNIALPRNTVDFYNGRGGNDPDGILRMFAKDYEGWSGKEIVARVPGDPGDQASWPKSGPVIVTADNVRSANAIPFQIVDCHDKPSACEAGTQCCFDGACRTSCAPPALSSAYGFVFSTETLPALPHVIERADCSVGLLQSPSPAKDARDACRNGLIDVEISRTVDFASVNTDTFVVIDCGSGASADCSASGGAGSAQGTQIPTTYSIASNGNGGSVLFATPTNGFTKNTWYRVTLVSDPSAKPAKGIRDSVNGQYLDGDLDRVQGGNYTYTFRTRDSNDACEISSVSVTPSKHTIDHQGMPASAAGLPVGFRADMLAANCNPLQCMLDNAAQYAIQWSTDDRAILTLPVPASGSCAEVQHLPVTAQKETLAGETVALTADVRAITGSGATKSGASAVTVAFTDPVVTEKFPDCEEACVNAQIGANFNVPMDSGTLTAANISLFRCRNASCNPPYADTQVPTPSTIQYVTSGASTTGFFFTAVGDLQPSSYYKVILGGGANGIKSSSGVPLTGLNEGDSYIWTFHTKSDGAPCQPSRSVIEPAVVHLSYLLERQDFHAVPFGPPDSCAASGQRLNADVYDWRWNRTIDPAISGASLIALEQMFNGFLSPAITFGGFYGLGESPATLDTQSVHPAGCSSDCRLIGSQTAKPQCGNGKVEKGEACDKDASGNFPAGCSPTDCLWVGTLGAGDGGTCGNDKVDSGEECDSTGGVFPPGCLAPKSGQGGCLLLGSSAATNAHCGDAIVGDGEACDDGNTSNGDGCSKECLLEGSSATVYYCGNGIVEPGEDDVCETTPGGPSKAGCDVNRCILLGTPKCTSGDSCCGNGVTDKGEADGCDRGNGLVTQGCTDRCVLAGSSYRYMVPSFCGDGVVGIGEAAQCEAGATGDGKIDAYQGYQVGFLSGADEKGSVTKLTAGLGSIKDSKKVGSADVTLSCVCSGSSALCGGLASFPLSCNAQGCCAPAPQVVQPTYPANSSNDVCRNTEIRITFDQAMDQASLQQNMFVGVYAPTGDCAAGTSEMPQVWHVGDVGFNDAQQPLWKRAWSAVAGFFHALFGTVAAAGATAPYPGNSARFCLVKGTVSVAGSIVTWSPSVSLPADTWVHVAIAGGDTGAKSASTAPMADSFEMNFGTSSKVCKIDRVSVEPTRQLFTIAEDLGTASPGPDDIDGDRVFTARAHPQGQPEGASIASTPEYAFKWDWDAQTSSSVLDLTARDTAYAANGYCEVGEGVASDCNVNLATVPNPKPAPGAGNGVCEAGESATTDAACAEKRGQEQTANVFVRRSGSGFPHDGEALVRVTADVVENRVNKSGVDATSKVTVLLCQNPWPARRVCAPDTTAQHTLRPTIPGSGVFGLPWDKNATCNTAGPYWSPFYDPATNISFYYCRDGGKGDAGTLLPALKEDMIYVEPGGNILREYLFPSPNGDAIGLRIAKNPEHRAVLDWYHRQGFIGSPSASKVDGYSALQEGHTTYVNAAALVPPSAIFTNVDVLSYSEGAKPETVAVYGQLLKHFNLNTNISDLGYCTIGSQQALFDPDHAGDSTGTYRYGYSGVQELNTDGTVKGATAVPVACQSDNDCWKNPTTGAALPDGFFTAIPDYRDTIRCATPKGKLTRDVSRWGDMYAMRDNLYKQAKFPTLEAGTFLRSKTTSAWDSWTSALGSAAGFTPPSDPVNAHAYCGASDKYDASSCWNATDKTYRCSGGSHVYTYRSIGGADFSIGMELETNCAAYHNQALCGTAAPVCTWNNTWNNIGGCVASAPWGGNAPATCLEQRSAGACAAAMGGTCSNDPSKSCTVAAASSQCGGQACVSTCSWDPAGFCSYRYGQVLLGGVAPGMNQCQDITEGVGGICGDGVLNGANEQCEPGIPIPPAPCTAGTNPVRSGVRQDTCTTSCTTVAGFCQVGVCGDGVVQSPERCDDGSLNGTYGHCNGCGLDVACQSSASCTGMGNRCGDGQIQPGESCDCAQYNGAYIANGYVQMPGVACTVPSGTTGQVGAGCAWDCRGPGPRCGDGIVNGNEQCDSETQTSRGYCNDPLSSPCGASTDCPVKTDGTHFACGNIPPEPERSNVRTCNTQASGVDSCQWGAWHETAPGQCGNGKKETGEECDDTTVDSRFTDAGSCVIDIGRRECKTNVCGDGYLNKAGGEQCDNGASENGKPCIPQYGIDCNYCSSSCKTVTISGGYCGDGVVQGAGTNPVGPEQCEPTGGATPPQWICRSTSQAFLSWGLDIGPASCDAKTCRFYCPYPESAVCENKPGTNTDKNGTTADKTLNFDPAFYAMTSPTGQPVTQTLMSKVLYDSCDFDKDGDGVPDAVDNCDMYSGTTHGAYDYNVPGYVNIHIPPAPDLCGDGIDNDCNGVPDDSPPVDVVFAVDVSGSMDKMIKAIADSVSQFSAAYDRCSVHKFGLVTIGSSVNDGWEPNLETGIIVQDLGSAADLKTGLNKLWKYQSGTSGPTEVNPTYGRGYELSADVITALVDGKTQIHWRSNAARKYIVVVTDTFAQSAWCAGAPDERGMSRCDLSPLDLCSVATTDAACCLAWSPTRVCTSYAPNCSGEVVCKALPNCAWQNNTCVNTKPGVHPAMTPEISTGLIIKSAKTNCTLPGCNLPNGGASVFALTPNNGDESCSKIDTSGACTSHGCTWHSGSDTCTGSANLSSCSSSAYNPWINNIWADKMVGASHWMCAEDETAPNVTNYIQRMKDGVFKDVCMTPDGVQCPDCRQLGCPGDYQYGASCEQGPPGVWACAAIVG